MRVYFTRTMRLFYLAIDYQQRSNLKNCGDIVHGNGKVVMKALKLLVPMVILYFCLLLANAFVVVM